MRTSASESRDERIQITHFVSLLASTPRQSPRLLPLFSKFVVELLGVDESGSDVRAIPSLFKSSVIDGNTSKIFSVEYARELRRCVYDLLRKSESRSTGSSPRPQCPHPGERPVDSHVLARF